MDSIGVIGVGVVGSAVKSYFSSLGLTVCCYDKFKEEYSDLEACAQKNILFLCLPTLYDVKEFNKENIYIILESLVKLNFRGIAVLKSTVEPGTTCQLVERFPKLKIVHNPEFLSADTALTDFAEQRHIVLGGSPDLTAVVAAFYRRYFPEAEITEATSTETESMKIFANSFYAVKIQFFNELYLACQNNGADFVTVKNMMLKNGWINPMHTQVPGKDGLLSYGGMCFPKDTQALLSYLRERNVPCEVLAAAVKERAALRQ